MESGIRRELGVGGGLGGWDAWRNKGPGNVVTKFGSFPVFSCDRKD